MVGSILDALARVLESAKGIPGLRRDQKRKSILRAMLEDPRFKWRSIDTLARAVGTSEAKARDLLISIGARASTEGSSEVWGLTSRVGSSGARTSAPSHDA